MESLHSDDTYLVTAVCPQCGVPAEVAITLTTLLKQTASKAQISITLSQEPASHTHHQLRVTEAVVDVESDDEPMLALPYVDHETGEILGGVVDAEIVDDDGQDVA